MSFTNLIFWVAFALSSIIALFLVFVGLSYFTPLFHTKGKCQPPPKPYIYAHRGDTGVAQENTVESALSALKKGYGVELDIDIIKTGEYVVFHDKQTAELTGVDRNLTDLSLSEFQDLKYLPLVHTKEYTTRLSPPLFKDYLDVVCKEYPDAGFIFDIKFDANYKNMSDLFDIIDASKCNCNSTNLITENPYFYNIGDMKSANVGKRCNVKVSFYLYPNTYPISDYLWMKSRFGLWYGMPDIIDIYYTLFDSYPEIFNSLIDDGWCTAVFNNYEKDLDNYHVNYYKIADLSPASHIATTKPQDAYITTKLITISVLIGIVLLIAEILLLIYLCKNRKSLKPESETLMAHEETEKLL